MVEVCCTYFEMLERGGVALLASVMWRDGCLGRRRRCGELEVGRRGCSTSYETRALSLDVRLYDLRQAALAVIVDL